MMRRVAYPYYLLALMATSVAVFFVMKKIDKHGFYHHYFRVIEDVESRNSQAIDTLPALLAEVDALRIDLPTFFQWLLGLLAVGVGLWLHQSPLTCRPTGRLPLPPLLRACFACSVLVRAP